MPLRELGTLLLVLVAVLMVGRVWFHLVEALIRRVKGLFGRPKDPPAWHPLPPDWEDKGRDG